MTTLQKKEREKKKANNKAHDQERRERVAVSNLLDHVGEWVPGLPYLYEAWGGLLGSLLFSDTNTQDLEIVFLSIIFYFHEQNSEKGILKQKHI